MSNYDLTKFWVEDDEQSLAQDPDLPQGNKRAKDVQIKIKAGVPSVLLKGGGWRPLQAEALGFCPPGFDGSTLTEDDLVYRKGSRWVYINGRWYKIG